jgi:hypothetical protein
MLRYSRVVFFCGLAALAAAAGGCQRGPGNLASVEGTVTREGSPLAEVQVIFWADRDAGTQGPRTQAITDESGHYRLRTDNGDEGAVVGKYRVCILDNRYLRKRKSLGPLPKTPTNTREFEEKVKQLKAAESPSRLPSSYSGQNETPLRVEVRPGTQVIDLEVK